MTIAETPDPSRAADAERPFDAARYTMSDTLRFAERMQLLAMQPRGELSSTGYALANSGVECLVLQPSAATEPFSLELVAGAYAVEWFSVNGRRT